MSQKPAKPPPRAGEFKLSTALLELLEEGLAPLLEPLGYNLEGQTLRRNCRPRSASRNEPPETVFLIEQVCDKSSGNEGSFTFELGVYYPALITSVLEMPYFSNLRAYLSPPRLAVCGLRQGLGELAKNSEYPWYMSPRADLRELTEEVTVAVLECGLPWLQARLDWRFLLQEPGGVLALAAWKRAGPREEFVGRLEEFLETETDAVKRSQLKAWSA